MHGYHASYFLKCPSKSTPQTQPEKAQKKKPNCQLTASASRSSLTARRHAHVTCARPRPTLADTVPIPVDPTSLAAPVTPSGHPAAGGGWSPVRRRPPPENGRLPGW